MLEHVTTGRVPEMMGAHFLIFLKQKKMVFLSRVRTMATCMAGECFIHNTMSLRLHEVDLIFCKEKQSLGTKLTFINDSINGRSGFNIDEGQTGDGKKNKIEKSERVNESVSID